MIIIDKPVPRQEIINLQDNFFGDMVKAVVDVRREVIAVDSELHADLEKIMLEDCSCQPDLWGINIYPEMEGEDYIEFDSMINIRPYQGNPSRDVLDPEVRRQIVDVVNKLIV